MEVGRWRKQEAKSRNAYSASIFPSRFVTLRHGVSRLVTGIPKDKKIVYFFMGTPNQTKSTPRLKMSG
jgi:hypothetical protein